MAITAAAPATAITGAARAAPAAINPTATAPTRTEVIATVEAAA